MSEERGKPWAVGGEVSEPEVVVYAEALRGEGGSRGGEDGVTGTEEGAPGEQHRSSTVAWVRTGGLSAGAG